MIKTNNRPKKLGTIVEQPLVLSIVALVDVSDEPSPDEVPLISPLAEIDAPEVLDCGRIGGVGSGVGGGDGVGLGVGGGVGYCRV
jgi:hypothetical protein